MITCPACGGESPDGFKFCGRCGAPLGAPSPIAEERKVVTTLFCDLVGSTAMGSDADPEDVDALLRRYNDLARRIVESHGGTVEKFIGDAVVAVFGVPHVHEDDPERAVRAGLHLVAAVADLSPVAGHPVQVRVGVNTGEALVRLDVTPGSGETFLTGDAVNVGARLQSAAPPMGVVVGETTHAQTAKSIAYEVLEPVAAKGKGEPLAVWLAKAPLARTAVHSFERATPFVGRDLELTFLSALLDKAADSASPQVALVVGEPGIGKSRLVAELFAYADASSRFVTWRQGRCLPYGDGVTFWALAEIVKVHAGILENDAVSTVEAKLEDVLPEGEDREWFRQRLRALLGLEAPAADRDENFAAWLRFLEDVAARDPAVLVIEDLHWADDALLAFVEHVATHVAGVPLLLVATTRPELFERHPAFASSGQVNRIALQPLANVEMEALVDSLLRETANGARETIVRHAEGNPFYAEESAHLMADQTAATPLAAAAPSTGTATAETAREKTGMAPTIQAVIAARLDALPGDLKAMLADAAVVGEAFWDGALAAIGERDSHAVDEALNHLIARQLVHRVRTSSMAGEREFAFGHALARDVAYGELPRAARARKHAAVAAWIEAKAGVRVDDLAEVLAHHYATALELARASGETELANALAEPSATYLTLAGDRVWPLDVAAAERYYSRALRLTGHTSPLRSHLLAKWARALTQLGRRTEAVGIFEEAIALLMADGDTRAAAVAQMGLASAVLDEDSHYLELADEAVAILEAGGPSAELVTAITDWTYLAMAETDSQRILQVVERGMSLSKELGLPEDAQLVAARGCVRGDLGDAGGVDDLKRALETCRTSGSGERLSSVFVAVGNFIYLYEGFQASLAVCTEGLDFARRRGAVDDETQMRVIVGWASENIGDWDRSLDDAVELEPLVDASGDYWHRAFVRIYPTLVLVEMGRAPEALDRVEWLEEGALLGSQWFASGVYVAVAAARMALGDADRALSLLACSEPTFRSQGGFWSADVLPRAVRIALAGGDRGLAERLATSLEPPLQPLAEHATVAAKALVTESRGDFEAAAASFADAAQRWHDFGVPYEDAHCLLGQGRCLVALGRAHEAAPVLERAREIFARLKAAPALEQTDLLLSQISRGDAAAAPNAIAPDGDGPPANGPEPDSKG